MNDFEIKIENSTSLELHCSEIDIVQVNIGLICNQECVHCHVAASPKRKEIMQWDAMELVIEAARCVNARMVDITGGAPELNPHFRRFIDALSQYAFEIGVHTNLTVLLEEGMEDMPEFYKSHRVQLVGSLPCYLEENVDRQRGSGVYQQSIEALKLLNSIGYGIDPELKLNLVYNPAGPVLPPNQKMLEEDYRRELMQRFGIAFTNLITITNMPIGRFQAELNKEHKGVEYLQLLKDAFNPQTIEGLMCRHQISVNWDGTIYDCDFNLALRWPVNHGAPTKIQDFDPSSLSSRKIVTGDHCFGCTAGFGSSCSGALTE
jgi:radical SAM/Cys-rich protein